MVRLREVAVEQPLVKEVKKRGGIAYKLVSPGRINVPDRLCIMPGGRIFFVECKAPGEKPREGQVREMKRLKELGCEVYTLDTVDNKWLFTPAANGEYLPPAPPPPPPRQPKVKPVKDKTPVLPAWVRRCTLDSCERPHYEKGLCKFHFERLENKKA